MLSKTVHLTATEIKGAGPILKQLVAAPGIGHALVIQAVYARLNFGGVAFAAGSSLDIYMGAVADNNKMAGAINSALINAAVTSGEPFVGAAGQAPVAIALIENVPLNLALGGAAFTTGTGSLDVTVFYSIT